MSVLAHRQDGSLHSEGSQGLAGSLTRSDEVSLYEWLEKVSEKEEG